MNDELLSVEQAASAYDVSMLTLRRRAQYGEIEGAVKLRGRRGAEWRFPASALEALGYERRQESAHDFGELLRTLRKLGDTLAEAQQENARLNQELGGALAEAARLRGQMDAESRFRDTQPRKPSVVDLREAQLGASSG